MMTRSQNNIFKPKKLFFATNHPIPEPKERISVTITIRDKQ